MDQVDLTFDLFYILTQVPHTSYKSLPPHLRLLFRERGFESDLPFVHLFLEAEVPLGLKILSGYFKAVW